MRRNIETSFRQDFTKSTKLALTAQHLPGLPTFCFKKVWKLRNVLNVRVAANHRPAQAQELPAEWGAFPIFGVTEIFCKIKSKFFNSRVLAGGFVMGCAKNSWF